MASSPRNSPKTNDAGAYPAIAQSPAATSSSPMSPEESRTRREQQQKAIERLSKPVIHATEDKNMETVAGGRKLDAEACEKMVTRLSPSGDIQDQKLQKLVAGVYKYEEPKRLPDSRIQENVERLTKFEMDQRKQVTGMQCTRRKQ